MKSALISIGILFLAFSSTSARTWLVGPDESFRHPSVVFEEMGSGDTVVIRKGVYKTESFVIREKQDIVILGEEAELLGIEPYGTVMSLYGCQNIVLSGLRMRHELGAQWEVCFGGVLEIGDSQNILVINCEMNGCGAIGLDVYSSSGVVCTNSSIHHNNRFAVRHEWVGVNSADSMRFETLVMFNNEYYDNGNIQFRYSWVDNLRVRKSYPDGEVLGMLSIYDRVFDLGERSREAISVELRGTEYTGPWMRIQTNEGLVGWVFAPALTSSLEDSEHFDINFYNSEKKYEYGEEYYEEEEYYEGEEYEDENE